MTKPLASWIGSFVLAEANRLSRKNHHRHLLTHGTTHAHGRMQSADRRVNHHCRQFAGSFGVTAGHTDGDFFVAGGVVLRASLHTHPPPPLPPKPPPPPPPSEKFF